jgi:hypothetical protein
VAIHTEIAFANVDRHHNSGGITHPKSDGRLTGQRQVGFTVGVVNAVTGAAVDGRLVIQRGVRRVHARSATDCPARIYEALMRVTGCAFRIFTPAGRRAGGVMRTHPLDLLGQD